MPRLTVEERCRLIGHVEAGCSVADLSRIFQVSKTSMYKLICKYRTTGIAKDLPKTGRPSITNEGIDRAIVEAHERDPFLTAEATAKNTGVSRQTVVRRLNQVGLKACRPAVRPLLSDVKKNNRLVWARQHIRWTVDQWSRVLFSDEATFEIDSTDRRLRCYRRTGERYDDDKVQTVQNRGYGTVMVWGGVVGLNRTPLVRLNGRLRSGDYIDQILEEYVVPLFHHGVVPVDIFMHDNAPPHRANVTKQFLVDENVPTMDWPAVSPDMNPIENVWSHMKRQLKKRNFPQNPDALFATLSDIWDELTEDYIQNLTQLMRRRVRALQQANGSHTKY